jgi:hypothetical protein
MGGTGFVAEDPTQLEKSVDYGARAATLSVRPKKELSDSSML